MKKRCCFILLICSLSLKGEGLPTLLAKLPKPAEHFFKTHLLSEEAVPQKQNALFKQPPRYRSEKKLRERVPDRYKKTYDDVVNLQILGASSIITLWLLPTNVSQWDHDAIESKNILSGWYENVTEGPVIDEDDWEINYIGHSLSGAYFYTLARNNGLTALESAYFNFLMSTFYWEYGVEAFFELPSIQDLIITPLLGSLLGEAFYQWQLKIRANEGKVFGSKRVGSFFMVLLNPEGALADFLKIRENRVKLEVVSRFSYYVKPEQLEDLMLIHEQLWMESYLGVSILIKF